MVSKIHYHTGFCWTKFLCAQRKGFSPSLCNRKHGWSQAWGVFGYSFFQIAQPSYPEIVPMEVKAYSKYARISPKKAREVSRVLPGRKAGEAASLLKYIPRKAAKLLGKTLQSAMANAENNNNLNADDLYISEAIVEDGPALKRFRPCARGSAHPYKKRMSHLRITLSDEF